MRKITCLLLLLCLLPSFALADKTITLTFTGDITLGGEDYLRTAEDSFFAVYEREGAGYFLKNFADFFAEDDLTVVNLEGVLTDNNALYPRDKGKGDDGYWFRGPAAYAKVLSAASVEVASLANNHAFDYGAQASAIRLPPSKQKASAGLAHTTRTATPKRKSSTSTPRTA